MSTNFAKEFKLYESMFIEGKNSISSFKRKNPTPPTALKIVKIEPWLQACSGYQAGQYRHCDDIYYIDPISNTEVRTMVWEENPGFGKYFGWGAAHSGHWDYAAYNYDGKLLPGIDPNAHISDNMKKALSDITNKINNPSENDEY